ncbi:hypothetical protein HN51_044416 [Arachis hypogaea]
MGRSSPNDKLLLVQALRKGGEVVTVTEDGTNDAHALHEADIGLSMGIQGTEVVKESSDIIILDDNFSSVVKNSFDADWKDCRSFHNNVKKLGPNSIVDKGSVYWIVWKGVNYVEPCQIVIFSLQQKLIYEGKISSHAKSTYYFLTYYNNGVGFMSYSNMDFTRYVIM